PGGQAPPPLVARLGHARTRRRTPAPLRRHAGRSGGPARVARGAAPHVARPRSPPERTVMSRLVPPRLARWLLERTLPPGAHGAAILADLLEDLQAGRSTPLELWRHALSLAIWYGVIMPCECLWHDARYAM